MSIVPALHRRIRTLDQQTARRRSDPHRDRGASLIVAIGFVVMIGTMTAGMSAMVQSSSNHGAAVAAVRNRLYAAEGAIDDAVAAVRALDRTTSGACSAGGGVSRTTLNGYSIHVDWINACLTVRGADGLVVGQRNVVFTACPNIGLACTAASAIASAQLNFQQGSAGGVTQTYVQSWSITGGAAAALDTPTPIASWLFDTLSGSATPDGSGTGPSLGWSSLVSQLAGTAGQALSFTGLTGSAATSASPVVDTTGSFTVSTWVKVPSLPTCLAQTAVSQDGSTISGFVLGLTANCVGSPAKFTFSMPSADSISPTQYTALGTTSVAAGTWYHVVAVRDATAGTMKLYVNAALEATAANTTKWSAGGSFTVGRGKRLGLPSDYLLGYVDTTNVYGQALSPAQVANLP